MPYGVATLSAFDPDSEDLNVIIETPMGSRNKLTYDETQGLFRLGGVLPAGSVFPFDFGFVPSTLGGDGDPLDVLVLMDERVFPGCLISARLVGVLKAEQTQKKKTSRNDRLIAVANKSVTHSDVCSLKDLNPNLIEQIEHFFISYNSIKGKLFKPLGRYGPGPAWQVVRRGQKAFAARTPALNELSYLIEILLPLYDNHDRAFTQKVFDGIRNELAAEFGGVTAFRRSPAEGVWKHEGGKINRDEIVLFEVMTDKVNREWWARYKVRLEKKLRQKQIVVRVTEVKQL
jgi:inorganic pyrophosphatase